MRVAFLGTPELAATVLRSLLERGEHEVVCVVSQPDRRAGRGKKLTPPPVAALARDAELPLLQPESCGTKAFREWLGGFEPDVAVVAAFGHILGPKALAVPRLGCVNVHASLLPRWRGASPIQAAILAGDAESGVTIMQMDRGLDTGPMLLKRTTPIGPDDTAETLHDRLAELGAEAIHAALAGLRDGTITPEPQDDALSTYAPLLKKSDGDLDWREPAVALERRVRGLHPWPGTRTRLDGSMLKVLPPVAVSAASGAPGAVLEATPSGVVVAAGEGALVLSRVQPAGSRVMDVAAFLAGRELQPGTVLG